MREDQIRKMASQAMDELVAAVEAGHSEKLKTYLATMGRFHNYSFGNQLLIGLQRPSATRVAGYATWRKLGRQVKRGEKGIRIMAPIVRQRESEGGIDEEERVVSFRTAHIFDVSQTDGKQLAEFAKANGDPGQHTSRLRQFVAESGFSLKALLTGQPAGRPALCHTSLAVFVTWVGLLWPEILSIMDDPRHGQHRPNKEQRSKHPQDDTSRSGSGQNCLNMDAVNRLNREKDHAFRLHLQTVQTLVQVA